MSILTDLRDTVRAMGTMMRTINDRHDALERANIIRTCSCVASGAFPGGYTTATYKRPDLTLALVSELSNLNPTTLLYQDRTESYYNVTGKAIVRSVVYRIAYDANRFPISETITTVSNF